MTICQMTTITICYDNYAVVKPISKQFKHVFGHEAQLYKLQEKFGGKIRSPFFVAYY